MSGRESHGGFHIIQILPSILDHMDSKQFAASSQVFLIKYYIFFSRRFPPFPRLLGRYDSLETRQPRSSLVERWTIREIPW